MMANNLRIQQALAGLARQHGRDAVDSPATKLPATLDELIEAGSSKQATADRTDRGRRTNHSWRYDRRDSWPRPAMAMGGEMVPSPLTRQRGAPAADEKAST